MSNDCRVCGGKTYVIDSRDDGIGKVRRRRRVCKSCGDRASTHELTAEQWKMILDIQKSADLIKEQLEFIKTNVEALAI